jgi:enamine deaminase RidA (YjgF/YER057c/UK114 family)
MNIVYVNPENMAAPRGYSHAVAVSGAGKTIYIGGQNAVDEKGRIVGPGQLKLQTGQALDNIEKILHSAGAKMHDVIKWTIYLVHGQNPRDGFEAFQMKWGRAVDFPAVTVLFVSGLGHPDWLVEIEAIAVVGE